MTDYEHKELLLRLSEDELRDWCDKLIMMRRQVEEFYITLKTREKHATQTLVLKYSSSGDVKIELTPELQQQVIEFIASKKETNAKVDNEED